MSRETSLKNILSRETSFDAISGNLQIGGFEPGFEERTGYLKSEECKVLVIGAGGLGCELLKDLALSGFKNIHVIDMDGIDVSNLNRQFLFRKKDVGRKKAEVAAEFIMRRVPDCRVTYDVCSVQEKDEADPSFFSKFKIVIGGLDNLDARSWVNNRLFQNIQKIDDSKPLSIDNVNPESITFFIDGGTEGFGGQVKVMIPPLTPCFECGLDTFPATNTFPLCTIRETPRIPEHCIAYAFTIEWDKHFPTKVLDKDDPVDMNWVYQAALKRAQEFHIEGVTYFLTIGVVKNVIPAIASTNAIISAACVNEAFKALTFSSQLLNNFMQYTAVTGLQGSLQWLAKKENCRVCGLITIDYTFKKDATLQQLLDRLKNDELIMTTRKLTAPSVRGPGLTLFMQKPPVLRQACLANLEKTLINLTVTDGMVLTVTDPDVNENITLTIHFN